MLYSLSILMLLAGAILSLAVPLTPTNATSANSPTNSTSSNQPTNSTSTESPTNAKNDSPTNAMSANSSATTLTAYFNTFLDPAYVLNSTYRFNTTHAQSDIVSVATILAKKGPWSVTSKNITPPSGNKQDFLSWAPYYWPNCTGTGNHSALTAEQVWTTCPYYQRDGVTNPDTTQITDSQNFENMATSVLFTSLAAVFSNNSNFTTSAVTNIKAWFLDNATAMNPNVNFGQAVRGPGGVNGSHNGVLDLHSITKVVSSILLFRKMKAPQWDNATDAAMVSWAKTYSSWLANSTIGAQERSQANNHGTFFINQLAALQILMSDTSGAKASVQSYFTGTYQNQIDATGSQPLEAVRTRPYHYQCYNLESMITNARLGAYLGLNFWNTTTSRGSTIKTATNYMLKLSPGSESVADLLPQVGETAAAYGDHNQTYANFLSTQLNNYYTQPFFFWSQPLAAIGEPITTTRTSASRSTTSITISNTSSSVTATTAMRSTTSTSGTATPTASTTGAVMRTSTMTSKGHSTSATVTSGNGGGLIFGGLLRFRRE